jgi:hypothetical protein
VLDAGLANLWRDTFGNADLPRQIPVDQLVPIISRNVAPTRSATSWLKSTPVPDEYTFVHAELASGELIVREQPKRVASMVHRPMWPATCSPGGLAPTRIGLNCVPMPANDVITVLGDGSHAVALRTRAPDPSAKT